jgi:hypothetical protein
MRDYDIAPGALLAIQGRRAPDVFSWTAEVAAAS